MRNIQFIVFFSIVFAVFTLISIYIYSRGAQAFPAGTAGRFWFKTVFIVLSLSYPLARFLERVWMSPVSDFFTWVGSFWLAIFFYALLIVIAIDIIRLLNLVIPVLPEFMSGLAFKQKLFWAASGLIGAIVLAGYINAISPRVKTLDLTVNKKVKGREELTIAFASDIHLGTLVGPRRTEQIVNMLNSLNADIILLGGDVVDEDLAPVIRNNLGESLKKLKAPLGVYGITGNHEYIGGASEAVKYLSEHGIQMIRDTAVLVNESFYVLGREDHDAPRFAGHERKSIENLIEGMDASKPIILLDHQPFALDKKEAAGIDLTMSGHTHHGQLWPLNYITKAIFEVSWGYKLKGNLHVYVSSGAGGWGPPVRVGNRPEVVFVKLKFQG